MFIENKKLNYEDYSPISKSEILELFQIKDSICRLHLERGIANGFFLELNNKDIPFSKCLLTCNHFLPEEAIEKQTELKMSYQDKYQILKITKNNRKIFTNEEIDYTLIEILPEDNIKKFLRISDENYNDNSKIISLSYTEYGEFSLSRSQIKKIKGYLIIHTCSSENSSGGPILLRRNLLAIGMNCHSFVNPEYDPEGISILSIINDKKIK